DLDRIGDGQALQTVARPDLDECHSLGEVHVAAATLTPCDSCVNEKSGDHETISGSSVRGTNCPPDAQPTKRSFSTSTAPRRIVVVTLPRSSHPSQQLKSAIMCKSCQCTVQARLGSMTAMSASLPTARLPFRGWSPMILAGFVEITSTKRLRLSRPWWTPR